MEKKKHLTTNQGVPIADNQNSLTVGERGPVLLQDVQFIEKMAHFDRERIPERVVHAKGAGAHGYFQVYKSMAPYTKAKFLQDPEKKTPVFVRFSTVTGGRGSVDTARDPTGICSKVLHRRRQLRPSWKQSSRVFHQRRHQISRYGSCFQG
jgi:catalase